MKYCCLLNRHHSSTIYSINWLISYWKADTNGSFPDSVWTNNWAINWATYTASWKINWAYDFDGVNDYIAIWDNSSLDLTSSITMSAWVKIDTAVNFGWIFYKWTNTGWAINYSIDLWTNWITPRFSWTNPNNSYKVFQSNFNLSTWVWYNIVAVHTWGSWANTKIYINWVDEWGSWTFWTWNESAITNNESLYVGRIYPLSIYLDWTIDEQAIWNRAITSTEATELYNSWAWKQYPFT